MTSPEDTSMIPPPPGTTPDFSGRSSVQIALISVFSVTLFLATAFLALRLYSVIYIIMRFGLNDGLIILAWLSSITMTVLGCVAFRGGYGKHLWNVSQAQFPRLLQPLPGILVSYLAGSLFSKLALLVYFRRLNPSRNFRWCVYAFSAIITTWTVTYTIILLWVPGCNYLAASSSCVSRMADGQAALNVIFDLILIIMPIPTIISLNLPTRQKVIVCAILGIGSGAIIAACIRIYYTTALRDNPDVSWTEGKLLIWCAIEVNLAIVCNCAVLLRPFIRRHLRWLSRHGPQKKEQGERGLGGPKIRSWPGDFLSAEDDEHGTRSEPAVLRGTEGVLVERTFDLSLNNQGKSISSDHNNKVVSANWQETDDNRVAECGQPSTGTATSGTEANFQNTLQVS
ncbi:hypothetical protein BGZ63DRAFT_408923 [Mariannaea sp. PMI_226]|nr:hypothetical protein BGZ63DRAFT_408923 [Mariannaea sp. PMI_226]